jgi:translation initiation factor IF-2
MANKRVYEIARERGLETQQVLRRLRAKGVEVKAAASTVTDADIEKVFGTYQRETVSPAGQETLPSWLSPNASNRPRTTTKAEIDAKKEEKAKRANTAASAKNKAIEQAKRLRQQMAEKKAAAAAAPPAAPAATNGSALAEPEAPVAEVEAPEVVDVAEPETVEVEAAPEAVETVEAPLTDEDVAPVSETPTAADLTTARAAAAEVAAEVAAAEEAAAPPKPLTEAELRRKAQDLAKQRAAESSAKKRAQIEAERLEAETREKDKAKKEKKKGKKGEAAASPEEEFVGSRKPRVGGPSRGTDIDRGGRSGPSRRRRVVIDAQASRRGPGGGKSQGRGGKRNRGDRNEVVEIDPTVPVTIHAGATVKELADAFGVGSTEVIKILMELGDFVTITQSLTTEQLELVAEGLERILEVRSAADDEEIPVFEDSAEELLPRAPVVTIMGHVDHGKTSLLDAIRETKVTESEAGGITQHIGAYQVNMPDGRSVTFLDTPGHEAFTALRARGAKVTDEAVLVVAADDGVKPQTIEAIAHARAAEVPIVVAINKIDKNNANPDKVKAELANHDLAGTQWGGTTEMVEVSAKQRINLDELIEIILLQADVLELKANPNTDASGYIIESKLDPGRGPVCTMLVARGTLKVGDAVHAGSTWGKVRALQDFRGKRVDEAPPSMPVEIIGFNEVPQSGEFCQVVTNERVARDMAQKRATRLKAELLAKRQRGLSLDDLFARIKEGEVQDLNIIVKADVAGSVEAIEQELGKIKHDEVSVRIIHSGVGGITQNDVNLASASSAIIMGFNVRPNAEARDAAQREEVDVRTYRVIYKLREDVEAALSGMLSPEEVEKTIGEAEIRQIFKATRIGTIAGCFVTNGKIERNSKIRLLRNGTVVHEGTLASLKRFKDDAKEVVQGYECGLSIEGYNDIKEGDVVEAYVIEHVERDLKKELQTAEA